MKVREQHGLVIGIRLSVEDATLVQDCLERLFGISSTGFDRIDGLDFSWPRDKAAKLQGDLKGILDRLEIADVKLLKVNEVTRD